jgi:uridine kinase
VTRGGEPRQPARARPAPRGRRPVIIGISGGTGSGKTTVAKQVAYSLEDESVIILHHDSYYHDQGKIPRTDRARLNYDHPAAFDTTLLVKHLERLLSGMPIQKPVYDFKTHTRARARETVKPADVILVEGILVLDDERLREVMDIKIYVEADDDERFIRRLRRDIEERGRTVESAIEQYLETVKPMHLEFIAPSKRYADIIIPGGGYNEIAIDLLVTKIRDVLGVGRAL